MKHIGVENDYDGRIIKNFKTVSEKEEILLVSALSDYFLWYSEHKAKVTAEILKSGFEIDPQSILNFWIKNIVKSEEVSNLISDIQVIADAINYTEKYLDKMIFLKYGFQNAVVHSKNYRSQSQAAKIKEIFETHSKNSKVSEIVSYLRRKKIWIDNLNYDQADRIIKACEISVNLEEASYDN